MSYTLTGRVTVKARTREYEPQLYVLESEIEQDGRVKVRGSARFVNRVV